MLANFGDKIVGVAYDAPQVGMGGVNVRWNSRQCGVDTN